MFGFIPISFRLDRSQLVPVLSITGISPEYDEIILSMMVNHVLRIIEIVQESGGKLMELTGNENMRDLENEELAIRFYIVFLNESLREEAISNIQRELG